MAQLIRGPFAQALERLRSELNARYDAARHRYPQLDPADVLAFLRDTVAPLVEAVHAHEPTRTDAAAEALFEVAVDAVGARLLGPGARDARVDSGWRRLLAAAPHLLAAEPRRVAADTANALHNLTAGRGARAGEWIELMSALVPVTRDATTWRRLGVVAAWRAGLAHLRGSALAVCRDLEPRVALAALGVEDARRGSVGAMLDRLAGDPWLWPVAAARGKKGDLGLARVATVGGFRGFGGAFVTPPDVAVADGALVAFDHRGAFAIHADVFGSSLRRIAIDQAEITSPKGGFYLGRRGEIRWEGLKETFPSLASSSSRAAVGSTLAIAFPNSHHVALVAPVEAEST